MTMVAEHEVLKTIRAAGILPVMVEGVAIDEDNDASMVTGTLEEFLNLLKTMGVKYVLVRTDVFDEADLIDTETENIEMVPDKYLVDVDESLQLGRSGSDKTAKGVNLANLVPELKQYKTHVGEISAIRLTASINGDKLEYCPKAEPWYESYVDLFNSAISKLEKIIDLGMEEEEARGDEQYESLMKNLKGLLKDSSFVSLKTQRAMKSYALEKLPELEELGEGELSEAIKDLNAEIEAKGLRKRAR